MILDSCFLIDLLRNDKNAKEKAEKLDSLFQTKGISSITIIELWRGILRQKNNEKEKQEIENLFHSLTIFPLGEQEAKKAAEIEKTLIEKGEIIDWENILIAATASVHNLSIVTRNIKHFRKIPHLKIETY